MKKSGLILLLASLIFTPLDYVLAQQPVQSEVSEQNTYAKRKQFVENARKYLGMKWQWNGRDEPGYPNIDCLGLLFLAHSTTYGTRWREFSYNASEIIQNQELGPPVKGLDGILSGKVCTDSLKTGDIIYLLKPYSIGGDKPVANINGQDYWVWHTGIYSDKEENLFLQAKPGYKVVEGSFEDILRDNIAIFVTRIK